MLVRQIWTDNPLRNFNYLIACPDTGDALVVDPLDVDQCLAVAAENSWNISQILNTHEHADHIGGNKAMVKATGATVTAHRNAGRRIPGMGRGVGAGDTIQVGTSVALDCMDTPGHTMSHICLLSRTAQPALFCGDTLFNAGAGNCHNGGHPDELYQTFERQLAVLGDNTRIYPGHDYLVNNLRFTLDREPGNKAATQLLAACGNHDPSDAPVTTIAQERDINTFFRLDNPSVVSKLAEQFPELGEQPNRRNVFLKLRELRNRW